MKTKKCRPVLVESKENTGITLGINITKNIPGAMRGQNYQLILISLEDEKIEVGDMLLDSNLKDSFELFSPYENNDIPVYEFYKVIATQDQLSPEYIAKFISQYNNGNVEDVEIKMDDNGEESWIGD